MSTQKITRILVSFLVFNLNVVQANTEPLAISSNMSAKVRQEFNVQYQAALKKYQKDYVALVSMTNPYQRFTAELDWDGRKMNVKENKLMAKEDRFDHCQKAVILFFLFSSEAKNLTEGAGALTKDDLMTSTAKAEDLAYPFIAEDSKDPRSAPLQMALIKAWQYRGKGEQGLNDFLNSCLNIPVEMYMWTDEELEDESGETF